MTELSELKAQRGTTRASITRIKKFVDTKAESASIVELECRLAILESYFKQILSYQASIDKLLPEDEGEQKSRSDIEDLYCDAKSRLLTLISSQKGDSVNLDWSAAIPSTTHSHLPKLKLPSFGGKYSEFPNFIGCFTKLVGNNPSLSKLEKLNHLFSCLNGPALRTVQGYEITDANYEKVLEQLKSRYDNKYLILREHVIALFNLPKVVKNSPSQLRQLIDTARTHLSSLLTLGSHEEVLDSLMVHLVVSKLDQDSQARWEESVDHAILPKWSQCIDVLNKRCQCLEAREVHTDTTFEAIPLKHKQQIHVRKHNPTSLATSSPGCQFCLASDHLIYRCPKFKELTVSARFEHVKQRALCVNCLNKGHGVRKCSSKKCKVCNQPHHTLLHFYSARSENTPQTVRSVTNSESTLHSTGDPAHPSLASSLVSNKQYPNKTLLALAVIQVQDSSGQWHLARALLDSASQLNFICENLAQILKLRRTKADVQINGIGHVHTNIRWVTQATIKSRINNFQASLPMYILPQITGLQPEKTINVEHWNLPGNLPLADPQFFKSQKVDILIGTDLFFQLLCVGQIKLHKDLPTLQKTVFGWVVAGTYSSKDENLPLSACAAATSTSDQELDEPLENCLEELVSRFWSEEEVSAPHSTMNTEESSCEAMFTQTTIRQPDGRFVVKIPFKGSPQRELGHSLEMARRRFYSLERKLDKDPKLKSKYAEFLKEYLNAGHMEAVKLQDIPRVHYFMPHRCVLRPESSTTKLRVVFDASARTSSNKSLNDLLMVGATIQDDLFSILIRFRCYRFAITADIAAMYRQVLVSPEDRNYQLILWRDNTTDEFQIFRLKTVTYGTASAPFLATRCLKELATEFASRYPNSAKVIERDFYMDDLLSGADTQENLYRLRKEVDTILKSAQFYLRKWYSNDPLILSEIPEEQREKLIPLNDSEILKTLGVVWEPSEDQFHFHYKPHKSLSLSSSTPLSSLSFSSSNYQFPKLTKRVVLSEIARLFDPLGLINPVVVLAKIFLQELWLLKLAWDESLPQELAVRWCTFRNKLPYLNHYRVPRFVLSNLKPVNISLHGFADASLRAYGCCFYLRTVNEAGQITVNLLTAKSRVAPSKVIRSLPCLELCAALTLARLFDKLKSTFPVSLDSVVLWSDAEIVLDWLSSHASQWKTYVANRVSEIQRLTEGAQWRYVNSAANPADLVSRGVMPDELANTFWFAGPGFLYEPEGQWPVSRKRAVNFDELPEKRKVKSVLTCIVDDLFVSTIYSKSNFIRNVRRFAHIFRFIENLKAKENGISINAQPLSASEFDKAFIRIVWAIQQHEFSYEIQRLDKNKAISQKSQISRLNPFLDEVYSVKILRVGGRLAHSELTPDRKFPILLPRKNHFVESYLKHLHVQNLHAGPSALVAILQQRFWVINARDYARRIVRHCVHCLRYRPRLSQQIMGDLPKGRVNISLPFTHTGVDFCGPFQTTYGVRGRSSYKSYAAIFVCFAVKAVHIEIVSDLTADAFIAALKRFTARRNLCRYLYCDNATNFVGACNKLSEFRKAFLAESNQKLIQEWCCSRTIEFRFIPPRAPHFGGLWEAAVKAAKSHLYKTLRESQLTFEELSTVMTQIEGMLNSRPITPISNDPHDLQALTPAHFLNQAPLETFPESSLDAEKINYLRRWQRVTSYHQHFWKRWSCEYVQLLQQRHKWLSPQPNIQPGQLVVVHEDNLPPFKWKLGRVLNSIAGSDGHTRVIDIHTGAGTIRRPIHKVAVLPIEEN